MQGKRKNRQGLAEFFINPRNSLSREAILMHRLAYDLQIAAARSGYFLEIYKGEVDQDGFDVILDDRDVAKKLQVKTVLAGSRPPCLKIHKALLRPHRRQVEKLGFEPSPEGSGYEGGVVLMVIACRESSIDVDYHYTDTFILRAFNVHIIARKNKASSRYIKNLYSDLQRGTSHERIKVRKSAFVRVEAPRQLLALAGMHSPEGGCWPYSLLRFISEKTEFNKAYAAHELRQLISDNDVCFCSPPLREA